MKKINKNTEYIEWKHHDSDITGILCAAGFILEYKSKIILFLSKSNNKYFDKQAILKKDIISRKEINFS